MAPKFKKFVLMCLINVWDIFKSWTRGQTEVFRHQIASEQLVQIRSVFVLCKILAWIFLHPEFLFLYSHLWFGTLRFHKILAQFGMFHSHWYSLQLQCRLFLKRYPHLNNIFMGKVIIFEIKYIKMSQNLVMHISSIFLDFGAKSHQSHYLFSLVS